MEYLIATEDLSMMFFWKATLPSCWERGLKQQRI